MRHLSQKDTIWYHFPSATKNQFNNFLFPPQKKKKKKIKKKKRKRKRRMGRSVKVLMFFWVQRYLWSRIISFTLININQKLIRNCERQSEESSWKDFQISYDVGLSERQRMRKNVCVFGWGWGHKREMKIQDNVALL